MGSDKRISTTAIAKKANLSTKEVFDLLCGHGWIEKGDDGWVLTALGRDIGGDYVSNSKFGTYIAWPESIEAQLSYTEEEEPTGDLCKLLSATALGERLNISAQRMNRIFSEIGWIEKGLKGWKITKRGLEVGGVQREHTKTGIPFVHWPESILSNATFSNLVHELEEGSSNREDQTRSADQKESSGFREKFEAKLRTTDGHYVRSKAEMLIDNWLYMAELVHAYERKLPVEEELYSDFYIPAGKVYIEYWGYENDPKYLARKEKKREIYARYGFKLIELEDKDIQNLDDVLPRMLLKHGVETY